MYSVAHCFKYFRMTCEKILLDNIQHSISYDYFILSNVRTQYIRISTENSRNRALRQIMVLRL